MKNNGKKVTISGIKESTGKDKTFINLITTYYDFLNDEEEDFQLTLAMKEESEKEYEEERIRKAFSEISKQTGEELSVPDSLTFDDIKKALAPAKGEEISIYEYTNKNGFTNFSLFEGSGSNTNFFRKSEPLKGFLKKHKISTGDSVVVPFDGFYLDTHNTIYDGATSTANKVDFSATNRKELYKIIVKTLKKDDGETAEKILNRLEAYRAKMKDKMTTSGILQRVGVFSSKSKNKGDLDFSTVSTLSQLVDFNNSANHAKIASVRALFKDDGKLYRTSEMKARTWYSNVPEIWTVTMMLDDTILQDFKAFTTPMQEYGLITKDDVKYLRENAENAYVILNFVQRKLIENHFVIEGEVDEMGKNNFIKVVGLRPANEDEEQRLFSKDVIIEETVEEEDDDDEELPIDIDELDDEEVKEEAPKKKKTKKEDNLDDDDDDLDDVFGDDDDLWDLDD